MIQGEANISRITWRARKSCIMRKISGQCWSMSGSTSLNRLRKGLVTGAESQRRRDPATKLSVLGICDHSIDLIGGLVAVVIALRTRIKSQERISELNRRALQLQINPHFFFNVLNSISNYIGRNDQKAAHFYLARFARLMRLSLESSRESWVELGKELDLLEAYLELEKLRKDQFEFEVICPEELRSKKVPPMFVQPFVENAVVHAFEGEIEHPGQITIRAIDEVPEQA